MIISAFVIDVLQREMNSRAVVKEESAHFIFSAFELYLIMIFFADVK